MNNLIKLEFLLNKFELIKSILKKEDEFNIILQRYNYYKKQLTQSKNGHYVNCVWSSNKFCEESKNDLCSCYYIDRFSIKLCSDIVNTIGLEYMLNC